MIVILRKGIQRQWLCMSPFQGLHDVFFVTGGSRGAGTVAGDLPSLHHRTLRRFRPKGATKLYLI